MNRHPRIFPPLTVLALGSALLVACADDATPPTAPASSAAVAAATPFDLGQANATLGWQKTARALVAAHGISPIVAARSYALLGVGQYGAAVAADEMEGSDAGGRALYEARRGAVAGASAAILSYLFPDAATALAAQLASDGSAGPGNTHPHFTRGVAAGKAVGARIIARAGADGFSKPWNKLPPEDPLDGGWVGLPDVAPAGFQFPTMMPWYMESPSQFRPASHPARGSAEYLAGLDAVRAAALARTPADSIFANFWNLGLGTETALGYWDERASELIAASGMDERTASHVMALVNSAAMDATIACWDAKYHYMLLRPTMADPTIHIVGGLPGFPYGLPNHPSYPSGHSCASASSARVIEHFFPAATTALESQVADAGRSRVVGGIHYPFDVATGQALGRRVADWALAYDAMPGGLLRAVERR